VIPLALQEWIEGLNDEDLAEFEHFLYREDNASAVICAAISRELSIRGHEDLE
jgi:hypothetical protein